MKPRIAAIHFLRILVAVSRILRLCLFPQGCNGCTGWLLSVVHLLVVHIEAKRLTCSLAITEAFCISQRLAAVSVASRCDVGLLELLCTWIVLHTTFLCLTEAKSEPILLHVLHALVVVGYHGLRLLLHLLHLVYHRLSLCRGERLVFLLWRCWSRAWRRCGSLCRGCGRLLWLWMGWCRCVIHCMKSQPFAKLLICRTINSPICFQSFVKLQTVLIALLSGSKHLTAKILSALADCTVFFQCVIELVYFIVWHILIILMLLYSYMMMTPAAVSVLVLSQVDALRAWHNHFSSCKS